MSPSPPRKPSGWPEPETPPTTTPRTSRSQGPSPNGDEAPSEPSPTGSSAAPADGFVADPGPEFDPELAPDPGALEDSAAADATRPELWEETAVRELLVHQGNLAHVALRVRALDDDYTWKHTEEDLRAIAPPLTRMLNRYDALRALASQGDELSLIAGVGTYATRNYTERRRLIAIARASQGEVPVSGRAAEPGTGPPEEQPDEQAVPPEDLGGPPTLRPRGTHGR